MRATLKSADEKDVFETVVSDPPPATLKKHKLLWTSKWWGMEDLPSYSSDEDLLHFKLESVSPATKRLPGCAFYREVDLVEANVIRYQAAKEAEQHALLKSYEAKLVREKAGALAKAAYEKQKEDAAWVVSKDNPANAKSSPVAPLWDNLDEVSIFSQNAWATSWPPPSVLSVAVGTSLPTLSEREAASKATLKEMLVDRKQAESRIPEPEEPKKRWMKKCE